MYLRSERIDKSEKEMDDEADLFAAEFLLPRKQCYSDLHDLRYNDLGLKKLYWKVYKAFLIHRAAELNCILPSTEKYLYVTLGRNKERTKETGWVPLDQPQALRKMIDIHLCDLGYSMQELEMLLGVSEDDIVNDIQNKRKKMNRVLLFP